MGHNILAVLGLDLEPGPALENGLDIGAGSTKNVSVSLSERIIGKVSLKECKY